MKNGSLLEQALLRTALYGSSTVRRSPLSGRSQYTTAEAITHRSKVGYRVVQKSQSRRGKATGVEEIQMQAIPRPAEVAE